MFKLSDIKSFRLTFGISETGYQMINRTICSYIGEKKYFLFHALLLFKTSLEARLRHSKYMIWILLTGHLTNINSIHTRSIVTPTSNCVCICRSTEYYACRWQSEEVVNTQFYRQHLYLWTNCYHLQIAICRRTNNQFKYQPYQVNVDRPNRYNYSVIHVKTIFIKSSATFLL